MIDILMPIIFGVVFVLLLLGLIFTVMFALTEKDIFGNIALISALIGSGFLILFMIILITGSTSILGSK